MKHRIPRIKPTDHMKCNMQKGPSEAASIPHGRGNEIIMGGREKGRDLDGREEVEGKRGHSPSFL